MKEPRYDEVYHKGVAWLDNIAKTGTDLLGDPIKEPIKHPGAYPAPPGSGPEGKICKECVEYCILEYNAKNYRKCGVIKVRWTHGAGTDIKAKSPACRYFS